METPKSKDQPRAAKGLAEYVREQAALAERSAQALAAMEQWVKEGKGGKRGLNRSRKQRNGNTKVQADGLKNSRSTKKKP